MAKVTDQQLDSLITVYGAQLQEIERLTAALDLAQQRERALVDALKYYAERRNWEPGGWFTDEDGKRERGWSNAWCDAGRHARKVLATLAASPPAPAAEAVCPSCGEGRTKHITICTKHSQMTQMPNVNVAAGVSIRLPSVFGEYFDSSRHADPSSAPADGEGAS